MTARAVLATLILALSLCTPVAAQERVFRDPFEQPCEGLPAPFARNSVVDYAWHYGVPFGTSHGWTANHTGNGFDGALQLQRVYVRAFTLTGPAPGLQGRVNIPSSSAGIFAALGTQCGNFDLPLSCVAGASSAIAWSTADNPPPNRCRLEPGRTYYLSFAWFNLPQYLIDYSILSTCECLVPNCVSQCQFITNHTP